MFAWVLIGGVLGARIWHILTPPQSMVEAGMTTLWYLAHPVEMLQIWDGGLGIPGAIIGGGLAMYLYTRKHKYNFGMWLDFAAPGLALAQAIGRWGNFFNQELYGSPSTLPWAIKIDPQYRLQEYRTVETYHPLFLYESLWNLLNMGLLLFLGKRLDKWLKNGDLFLIYLMMYGLGRFLLEYLRLDFAQVGGINFNQTVMAVVGLAAAGFFIWRHSKFAGNPTDKSAEPVKATKTASVKSMGKSGKTAGTKSASTTKPVETNSTKNSVKPVAKTPAKKPVKSTKNQTTKTK